jgi:hypothetical protein
LYAFLFFLFQARLKLANNANVEHAKRVFHNCAADVMRDTMSYLRIQANNEYLWNSERKRPESKRASGEIYLTEEQYRQVQYFVCFYDVIM